MSAASASRARKRLQDVLESVVGRTIPLPTSTDRAVRAQVWREGAAMIREAAHRTGWDTAETRRNLVELAEHFDERAAAEGCAS